MSGLTRRQILMGLAGTALGTTGLVGIPLAVLKRSAEADTRLLSACSDRRGNHFLACVDAGGELIWRLAVPQRAHAVCLHPDQRSAVFLARRPGRHSWQVDTASGELLREFELPANQQFNGHGVISPAADYLFTTETHYYQGQVEGRIGYWRLGDGQRVSSMSSHGLDPHECLWLGDGRLVVANGGLLTSPSRERAKLNIGSMQPSLVYLQADTGALLQRLAPPQHQLSLRHMAVSAGGLLAVGMQYEGSNTDNPALVAVHRGGDQLTMLAMPEDELRGMRHYIASVAFNADGSLLAATSPRGSRIALWRSEDGQYLGSQSLRDVAGATALGEGFVFSNGVGELLAQPTTGSFPQRHQLADFAFDNHMLAMPG